MGLPVLGALTVLRGHHRTATGDFLRETNNVNAVRDESNVSEMTYFE